MAQRNPFEIFPYMKYYATFWLYTQKLWVNPRRLARVPCKNRAWSSVFDMWTREDLNLRPLLCKSTVLPTELRAHMTNYFEPRQYTRFAQIIQFPKFLGVLSPNDCLVAHQGQYHSSRVGASAIVHHFLHDPHWKCTSFSIDLDPITLYSFESAIFSGSYPSALT